MDLSPQVLTRSGRSSSSSSALICPGRGRGIPSTFNLNVSGGHLSQGVHCSPCRTFLSPSAPYRTHSPFDPRGSERYARSCPRCHCAPGTARPFLPPRGTWETLRAIVPGPGEPHFQGSKVPSLTSDVAQCGSNIHGHWPARPRGLCFGCKCSPGARRARTNQPVDPNSPCIVTALYIDKLVGPGTLTGRMELGSDLGTGQAVSCGRYQMRFPLSPTPFSFPLLWEGSPSLDVTQNPSSIRF
jgi:hypothetical protein